MRSPFSPRLLPLAALLLLGWQTRARADDPTPHPFPADRYNAMAAHSPFAPPTEVVHAPVAPTPPPGPSWSEKLTVTNAMQDHDGMIYATVVDLDNSQHLYLNSATQDTTSHLKIADVKWVHSGDREQPLVTLIRDNVERAPVRFDPGTGEGPVVGAPHPVNLPGTAIPANTYRPPAVQGNPVATIPPPTSTNFQRRAPVRALPPPATGGAGRPVVLPGQGAATLPVRPGPQQLKTDDEDDDD